MSDRRETLAELAMRQQMRAANRLVFSTWLERFGAQIGLMVILGGVVGVVAWRLIV